MENQNPSEGDYESIHVESNRKLKSFCKVFAFTRLSAVFLVSFFLNACTDHEKVILMICGEPPGVVDATSDVDSRITVNIDAQTLKLTPISGAAAVEYGDRVRSVAHQIFRDTGESAQRRAEALFEYRVCATVADDKALSSEKKSEFLYQARIAISDAARKVHEERKTCIDNEIGKATEMRQISNAGGARANAPGIGGGRNKASAKVCALIPSGFEILGSPSLKTNSCFGGRCKAGPFEVSEPQSDGSRNICVQVETWSDSKAFGGGGSYQVELAAAVRRSPTTEQLNEIEKKCGY